jgi:hypothetical protein
MISKCCPMDKEPSSEKTASIFQVVRRRVCLWGERCTPKAIFSYLTMSLAQSTCTWRSPFFGRQLALCLKGRQSSWPRTLQSSPITLTESSSWTEEASSQKVTTKPYHLYISLQKYKLRSSKKTIRLFKNKLFNTASLSLSYQRLIFHS